MDMIQKLRYMGRQYAAGQEARGGGRQKHYLEEAADEIERLRGAALWALMHHQGGSSPVGQPLRRALGIAPHDGLTQEQYAAGKAAAGEWGPLKADAERSPTVCTKDPAGCWNVRCQLGKHCVKDVTDVR